MKFVRVCLTAAAPYHTKNQIRHIISKIRNAILHTMSIMCTVLNVGGSSKVTGEGRSSGNTLRITKYIIGKNHILCKADVLEQPK